MLADFGHVEKATVPLMAYVSTSAAPGSAHGCLGPPGLWVKECRQPGPIGTEAVASCLECRKLIVAFPDGTLWVPHCVERFIKSAFLRLHDSDLGQEWAESCPGCDERYHGSVRRLL